MSAPAGKGYTRALAATMVTSSVGEALALKTASPLRMMETSSWAERLELAATMSASRSGPKNSGWDWQARSHHPYKEGEYHPAEGPPVPSEVCIPPLCNGCSGGGQPGEAGKRTWPEEQRRIMTGVAYLMERCSGRIVPEKA